MQPATAGTVEAFEKAFGTRLAYTISQMTQQRQGDRICSQVRRAAYDANDNNIGTFFFADYSAAYDETLYNTLADGKIWQGSITKYTHSH